MTEPSKPEGIKELPEWERKYNDQLQLCATVRGRRFLLCRHMNEFTSAIKALPIDEKERQELVNFANVLLRMAIIKNDGGTSPHRVPAF